MDDSRNGWNWEIADCLSTVQKLRPDKPTSQDKPSRSKHFILWKLSRSACHGVPLIH